MVCELLTLFLDLCIQICLTGDCELIVVPGRLGH